MENKYTLWLVDEKRQGSLSAGEYDSAESAKEAIPQMEKEFFDQGWDGSGFWDIVAPRSED